MAHATPTHKIFASGFPAALDELRALTEPVEPDAVFALYALLRAAGMRITYYETDVLSGHALQFIYHRDHPDCADLAHVPPLDTLLRTIDATWTEVIPSGPLKAFEFLQEWISAGKLVLARLKMPLLIYGYAHSEPEPSLIAVKAWSRFHSEIISLSECEKHFWRYPLDDGNVLLAVEDAPDRLHNMNVLVRGAARKAVRAWHEAELAGCASGDEAYRQLAADLANMSVDFTEEKHAPWMGRALWKQWTARVSSRDFFERLAPRYGGAERKVVTHAAFCYAQCVEHWQDWARYLGPTWHRDREGFPDILPDDFIVRWHSRDLRTKAAVCVEQARSWEEKAILELTKIIQ